MWEQIDRILRQATSQIVDQVADFLPGVVVSLVLLLTAVLVAVVVRVLLVRVLRGLEFDRRAELWGLAGFANWSASSSPSLAVARATSWVIFFLGVLVSLTALNATIPSRLAMSMFEYVPHLLAALIPSCVWYRVRRRRAGGRARSRPRCKGRRQSDVGAATQRIVEAQRQGGPRLTAAGWSYPDRLVSNALSSCRRSNGRRPPNRPLTYPQWPVLYGFASAGVSSDEES